MPGPKTALVNATPLSTTATDALALLQNFATERNGATGIITLSGLPPSAPFTVIFYGTNGTFSDGSRGTKFTLYKDASLKTSAGSATTSGTQDTGFATPGELRQAHRHHRPRWERVRLLHGRRRR